MVRLPSAVGVVLQSLESGVMLLHRHRFITNTEGFEIPAGGIDDGESVEEAAAREVLEETGWRITEARHFLTTNASDGATDQRFHFVHAMASELTGPPEDSYEASSLHWVPVDDIPDLLRSGRIPGALSSVALLHALQFGLL
ncbi:NUDIX hydrolase [Streptomyces sp. NPDC088812]|uniref:NUDIX hydrolase n=1 Tax=Streptomyces sp. NPDC088812 TaxID=3365905 RepID=UPI00380D46B4